MIVLFRSFQWGCVVDNSKNRTSDNLGLVTCCTIRQKQILAYILLKLFEHLFIPPCSEIVMTNLFACFGLCGTIYKVV